MQIYTLIKPLGMITYAFLILTATSGFFRWKFKYHKTFAFTTIALATLHFIVIIIANS